MSGLAAKLLRVDGMGLIAARGPGDLTGKAPKQYGTGRRCRCGSSISTYTKGEWCHVCIDTPDRKHHYTRAPKGIHMATVPKMKAKQAADYLGVTGQQLKELERAGRITVVDRGRGLFGSHYCSASVERAGEEIRLEREAEKAVQDAATMRNGKDLDHMLTSDLAERQVDDEVQRHLSGGVDDCPAASDVTQAAAGRKEYLEHADGGPVPGPQEAELEDDETPVPCKVSGEAECPNPPGLCCESEVVTRCICIGVGGTRVPPSTRPCPRHGDQSSDLEITSAEPGYPNPADFDANDEGAAQYEQACKDFEGPTRLVALDKPMKCCAREEECGTGECVYADDVLPEESVQDHLLDVAWGVIANANIDDWNDDKDKTEWRVAAERWRDEYHLHLGSRADHACEPECEPECLTGPGFLHDDGPAEAPCEDTDLLERAVCAAERASMTTEIALKTARIAIDRLDNIDPEAVAIDGVVKALDGLDRAQIIRVLRWTTERFEVNRPLPQEPAPPA